MQTQKKICTNQCKVRFLNIIGPLKKYPVYTKVSCMHRKYPVYTKANGSLLLLIFVC